MKNLILGLILIAHITLWADSPVYDLFIYSGCPYGISAVSELLRVTKDLPNSSFEINFGGEIIEVEGKIILKTGLESGRVEDELLFLAVENLYPTRFLDFVWLISDEGFSVKNAATQIELDSIAVKSWIEEFGEEKLKSQYEKSEKLQISSSPTLFINGFKYSLNSTYNNLIFEECRGDTSRSECFKFGECFIDKHCKQGEQVAVCEREKSFGRCVSLNEPKLKLYAIIPDEYRDEDIYDFLDETSSFFPTISPTFIKLSNPKAKDFLKLTGRSALPLFFFDKNIESFHNFKEIEQVVEKREGFYTFKDSVILGNYFFKRKKENHHTLFVSPTNLDLIKVLELEQKYELQVLPNPQKDLSERGVALTQSWLKEDSINLSVEEYIEIYLKDINLSPNFLLLKNNRELFTLPTIEELSEVLEWIESGNE
jgi:hypothetical protein